MSTLTQSIRSETQYAVGLWDRFWFTPAAPHTLAAIRIATGLMLLYINAIWAYDAEAFLGPDAWINKDIARSLHSTDYAWSYLWYIDSPALIKLHQGVAIIVAACVAAGAFTRIALPVAWLMFLMLVHRLTGALFGLDQMMSMLLLYLMISPCGSVWSVDAALRNKGRAGWLFPSSKASVATQIAMRLLQIHLCVIYLFGGVGKMRGEMWWDGTAMWFAVSNYEYQSLDMTWIAAYPRVFSALSHMTVFWETFYCALVWPRLTRPLVIATAFAVHGGIAISLGMITFGITMIIANSVFISPAVFQWLGSRITSRLVKRERSQGERSRKR